VGSNEWMQNQANMLPFCRLKCTNIIPDIVNFRSCSGGCTGAGATGQRGSSCRFIGNKSFATCKWVIEPGIENVHEQPAVDVDEQKLTSTLAPSTATPSGTGMGAADTVVMAVKDPVKYDVEIFNWILYAPIANRVTKTRENCMVCVVFAMMRS